MSFFRHPFWNSVVSFRKRPSSLPVAGKKRVYKTIPQSYQQNLPVIVICRNGNNDDGNELEIPEKKKKTSIGNSNKNF